MTFNELAVLLFWLWFGPEGFGRPVPRHEDTCIVNFWSCFKLRVYVELVLSECTYIHEQYHIEGDSWSHITRDGVTAPRLLDRYPVL